MFFRLSLLSFALIALGCSDEPGTGGGGGGEGAAGGAGAGCSPGEIAIDGACQAAGLPSGWEAPTIVEPPAGVPDEGCGEGFLSDGEAGCTPVLPSAPCQGDQMAVPGDTSCRAILDCGEGSWGDLPVDADTVHVDASFTGPPDGSSSAPYPTIQAAVDVAPDGALVAVAAGTYPENVVVEDRSVRIWGRCPALVVVAGSGGEPTIRLANAPVSEVGGLGVTGDGVGLLLVDSPGSLVTDSRVHDTGDVGLATLGHGPAVIIADSVFERATFAGVIVRGNARIEGCEMRQGQPAGEVGGRGIDVAPWEGKGSNLVVEGSHLHDLFEFGILGLGSRMTVRRSLVTDTLRPADFFGWGIAARDEAGAPASLTVGESVVQRNQGTNVSVEGSSAFIENTTIEDGLPDTSGYGSALLVSTAVGGDGQGSQVTIERSTLRDHRGYGVQSDGSQIELRRTRIERVVPTPQGTSGVALQLFWLEDSASPNDALVEDSLIQDSHKTAVNVIGSSAVLRRTLIRNTDALEDGELALGLYLGPPADDPTITSDVTLLSSAIDDSEGAGVLVDRSRLHVDGSLVANSRALPIAGDSGAALGVTGSADQIAELTVLGSRLTSQEGRAILASDARVDVNESLIDQGLPNDLTLARGIELQASEAVIRRSLVEGVVSAGILAASSTATVEGVLVREVNRTTSGGEGFGLVATNLLGSAGDVLARGCRFEQTHSAGVLADGALLRLEAVSVEGVGPDAAGRLGRGVVAQADATLTLASSEVSGVYETGIQLNMATGLIASTTVSGVSAAADDGLFGDGIAIIGAPDAVTVRDSEVREVARAALSSFGSAVRLERVDLRCNDLALAIAPLQGVPPLLDDLGGNRCGCAEPSACKAISADLAPPEALPPATP